MLGGKAPLCAPHGAKGGIAPLPYPDQLDTRGGKQGRAPAIFSSINWGLEGSSCSGGGSDHPPD